MSDGTKTELAFPKKRKKARKTRSELSETHRVEAILEGIRRSPCAACGKTPSDPDHILSRGAGGLDTYENLQPLCRKHHTERHAQGLTWLAEQYPGVKRQLIAKGWEFDLFRMKWRHSG